MPRPADPYGRLAPPSLAVYKRIVDASENAWGEICFAAGAFLYLAEHVSMLIAHEFFRPLFGNVMNGGAHEFCEGDV